MIRHCDGNDPDLIGEDGKAPCKCGATFNEKYWTLIFPHEELPEVHWERVYPNLQPTRRLSLRPRSLDPRNRPR